MNKKIISSLLSLMLIVTSLFSYTPYLVKADDNVGDDETVVETIQEETIEEETEGDVEEDPSLPADEEEPAEEVEEEAPTVEVEEELPSEEETTEEEEEDLPEEVVEAVEEIEEEAEEAEAPEAVKDRGEFDPDSHESKFYGYVESMVDTSDLVSDHASSGLNKANIPSSFDLRNGNWVTPVKNQNPYGTCWTFAAMGSAESIYKKKYNTTLDLSELQLAWETYNNYGVSDPMGLVTYDGGYYVSKGLDMGGNDEMAIATMTSGIGPSTESAKTEYVYTNAKGTSTYISQSNVYAQNYTLKDAVYINMANTSEIKEFLMNNGALSVSYFHDDYFLGLDEKSYYNWYYKGTNHAVTLVGWDDNYSRYNFYDDPGRNGAWLIKNSWGTGYFDQGYMWISYEDVSIKNGNAVGYFIESPTPGTRVYQYDGSAAGYRLTKAYTSFKEANIYTASQSGVLDRASFFVVGKDITYTIKVYTGVTDGKPISGTLAATKTGTVNYGGYHMIDLDTGVQLYAGTKFSIVVELKSPKGMTIMVDVKEGEAVDPDYNYVFTAFKNSIHRGESFGGTSSLVDSYSDEFTYRVKGYTIPNDLVVSKSGSSVAITALNMDKGDSIALKANYANATWTSSNSSAVTVTAGTDGNATIKMVKPEEATITVKYSGVTKTITVKPNVYKITLNAGVGSVNPSSIDVYYNQAISNLPTPVCYGNTFNGWYYGSTQYTNSTVYAQKSGMTLTAKYTPVSSKLYYNAGIGTTTATSKTCSYGTAVGTMASPTAPDGYEFAGWFTEDGTKITSTTKWPFVSDTKVYAQYVKNEVLTADLTLMPAFAKSELSGLWTAGVKHTMQYTGKPITQDFRVYDGYKRLTLGKDYTVTYKNNTNVGTADIIIKGKGNYNGTATTTFSIVDNNTGDKVYISKIAFKATTISYEDYKAGVNPVISAKLGKEEKGTGPFTFEFPKDALPGKNYVAVTGRSEVIGTVLVPFTIAKYNINEDPANVVSVKVPTSTAVLKGGAKVDVSVKFDNRELVMGTDYTVKYANNKAAGTMTVTIAGKGNFTGSIVKEVKVNAKPLSDTVMSVNDPVYANKKGNWKASVSFIDADGKKLAAKTDYDANIQYQYANGTYVLDYSVGKVSVTKYRSAGTECLPDDCVPAGTAIKVVANGVNNYTGTSSKTYYVVSASIAKAKVTIDPQAYTGKPVSLSKSNIHVVIGGVELSSNEFEIVSYLNNTKAGKGASVTIKGIGNYGGMKTVKYSIIPMNFVDAKVNALKIK